MRQETISPLKLSGLSLFGWDWFPRQIATGEDILRLGAVRLILYTLSGSEADGIGHRFITREVVRLLKQRSGRSRRNPTVTCRRRWTRPAQGMVSTRQRSVQRFRQSLRTFLTERFVDRWHPRHRQFPDRATAIAFGLQPMILRERRLMGTTRWRLPLTSAYG